MKNISIGLILLISIGLLFAHVQGNEISEEEQRLVRKAKYFKTVEDYQEYLKKYPNGIYAEEARKGLRGEAKEQIEERKKIAEQAKPAYEEAIKKNTEAGYAVFLERYPNSSYAEEIKKAHDELLWEYVKKHNGIEFYKMYIIQSLSGIHVEEAERLANSLLRERIEQLEAKVKPIPASDYAANLKIYKELLKLDLNNDIYRNKVNFYSKKISEQKRKEIASKGFVLELVDWHWSSEHGYVTAEGQIKNISGRKLERVEALVTW